MLDITTLAAPIVDLLRAIGTGRIPPGGTNAMLSAASAAIDTARTTARTAADQMGQHWASTAADTAAAEAHHAQGQAQRVINNGDALAANLERAAADVERAMLQLAAILEHFVVEVGPWIPTLLTSPAGLVLILESAAEHLRQALIVVDRTRTELADRKRELAAIMGERIHDTPPPEPQGSAPAPSGTGPAVPSSSAPAAPETTTAPVAPEAGPVDTDSAGGAVLPGDGLTPEQYAGRPLYPGGPTPDPTGQPGVTGPIPPPGRQAPAQPAPATTGPPPGPAGPFTTAPPPPSTTTAPPPARLPDQPGVIGPGSAPEPPPVRVDQPGVIGPPPES